MCLSSFFRRKSTKNEIQILSEHSWVFDKNIHMHKPNSFTIENPRKFLHVPVNLHPHSQGKPLFWLVLPVLELHTQSAFNIMPLMSFDTV